MALLPWTRVMAKMIGLRRAKNFRRANVSMISEFVGQTILRWRVQSRRSTQLEDRPLLAQVISIIDDDASVREATQRLLRSLGYIARAFASADEFLRSSQVSDNSCLITDVKMPGMSGVELQRHLQIRGCHVPIIFITSFSEESIRTQALNAGAVCFLTKPFDIRTLIKHLDEALKRRLGAPTSEFLAPVQRT
jgi:CheY-like chemotaxis protein